MKAIRTNLIITGHAERVYDLDPSAAELWAVAGPDGVDPATIDPDNLPPGFRWLSNADWEGVCSLAAQADFPSDEDGA